MRVYIVTFLIFGVLFPDIGQAQDISVSIGDGNTLSNYSFQLFALITILSLAPGLAIMVTCFPFIVTVLSILRQALGLQQSPPNMLIVSLALFLTYYIMDPVFQEIWRNGIAPLQAGEIGYSDAFNASMKPLRAFMATRVEAETFATLSELRSARTTTPESADLSILIPSFMLSELARAFQIGFLIFMPFLIIDLVVAAILMSMGMMMVPPVIVALPFKLGFFVVSDGWRLIAEALVRGYG
jgi:flagellar biosynthetic protein FliP